MSPIIFDHQSVALSRFLFVIEPTLFLIIGCNKFCVLLLECFERDIARLFALVAIAIALKRLILGLVEKLARNGDVPVLMRFDKRDIGRIGDEFVIPFVLYQNRDLDMNAIV